MMHTLAASLAAAMLLGAGHASATEDHSVAAPTAPPSAAPPTTSRLNSNQVVCKREEETGSRLGGTKICHTREEWAAIAAASRTSVDRMQSGANLSADRH